MAKIAEIVYDVREALKEYSDDSNIDDRYILFLYNIKRDKYLRQDMNDYGKSVDVSVLQTFCESLIEVSTNECDVDTSCSLLLRTKNRIPKPLDLHTKPAITKIKPVTRIGLPFTFTTKERIPYLTGSKFSKGIYGFLDTDGYIYFLSKSDISLLECVSITGVFSNPMELENYSTCCDCNEPSKCFDEETTEYPLPNRYVDVIRMEIINELAGLDKIKEDTTNDAEDTQN